MEDNFPGENLPIEKRRELWVKDNIQQFMILEWKLSLNERQPTLKKDNRRTTNTVPKQELRSSYCSLEC